MSARPARGVLSAPVQVKKFHSLATTRVSVFGLAPSFYERETYMLQESKPIPPFILPSDRAGEVSSEGLLGTRYVLFVYPKDDTFG